MSTETDYKSLISEIIHKQMDILGPEIALRIAKGVKGLKISGSGEVGAVNGDQQEILQNLVQGYIALSGQIVNNILQPVFAKYPEIKLKLP